MNFTFRTKPSTGLVIASLILTTFTTIPTWTTMCVQAINLCILAALVWQARREGRSSCR